MRQSLFLKQLLALSSEELRDLLWRTKSIVLILVFAILLGIIIWAIPSLNYSTQSLNVNLLVFNLEAPKLFDLEQLLDHFGFENAGTLAAQAWQIPSAFWIAQLLLFGFYPLLLSIITADCITRDLQRGTLRLILCRSTRLIYFFAKLLAHLALLLLLLIVALLTVFIVVTVKHEHPADFNFVKILFNYFAVSSTYALACLALTLLVSATCRRVKDALLRIQLVWTFVILLTPMLLNLSLLGPQALLGFMLPFGTLAYSAITIFIGWSMLLGTAAFWVFSRKEV